MRPPIHICETVLEHVAVTTFKDPDTNLCRPYRTGVQDLNTGGHSCVRWFATEAAALQRHKTLVRQHETGAASK